jgi:hypothetical protein
MRLPLWILLAASLVPAAEAQVPLTAANAKELVLADFLNENLAKLLSKNSDTFAIKHLEPDEDGKKSGWGIDYDWSVVKTTSFASSPADGAGPFVLGALNFELSADGSYVFGDAVNDKDLSTITAALRLERGDFGEIRVSDAAIGKALQNCLLVVPFPTVGNEAEYNRESAACMLRSRAADMIDAAPGASYYWVDFHGGLEANQNYSRTRTVFGLAGAYAYQLAAARAGSNVFDLPFRWMRRQFSGLRDTDYVAPFPSVLLGVERLDADAKDPRSALTDNPRYTRAKAEVAFNTQVARVRGQIVRFNVSYRYFKELSAPAAVKAAELDEFEFTTATLRFPAKLLPVIESSDYEFFVSYTSGKLPFGVESEKTYELGISSNIDALMELLGSK